MPHNFNDNLEVLIFKLKNSDKIEILKQAVPVLMGIYIFLNPFSHVTSIKEVSFYLSIAIIAFLMLFKRIQFTFRTPLLVSFGFFVFWAFLSSIFALDKDNSFHDLYSHLIKYIILYLILINFFNSQNRLVVLSWIIIISTSIFSIGGFIYDYIILGNVITMRFGLGIVQTPTNLIGIVILFAMILAVHIFTEENNNYRKFILSFCILTFLTVTLLTQTRSNFVAMIIAFIVLLIRNKKILLFFLFVFVAILFLSPIKERLTEHGSIWHRVALAYISLEIIKDYPILGTGFGMETFGNNNFIDKEKYNSRVPPQYRLPDKLFEAPHNMLLCMAGRVGIVGLIFFLYMLLTFFIMCMKLIRSGKNDFIRRWGLCVLAAGTMLFIKGLFEPIFSQFIDVILFTIFAMASILYRINQAYQEN